MKHQRKLWIEYMEGELDGNDSEAEFIRLKIQLLKGVDDFNEFETAINILVQNWDLTDTRILSFLVYEGIFSTYADLYPVHEMPMLESCILGSIKDSVTTAFLAYGLFPGILFVPSLLIVGALQGYLLDIEATFRLDMSAQIRLFLRLEKIQGAGPRNLFIKTVVSEYESGWYRVATSCDELIYKLKSKNVDIDINEKWLHLLNYMANVTKNNGTLFYQIVSDRNRLQNCLGFNSLMGFTLFAHQENIPGEIHALISKKYLELSTDDRKFDLR